MRRAALAACAVAALGCGGGDDDESPLVGVWVLPIGSCVTAYVFDDDGTYESRLACDAEEVEVYAGYWTADGTTLTLDPVRGTCPPELAAGAAEHAEYRYELLSDRLLRIRTPSSVLDYERHEPAGGSGGAIRLGCYEGSPLAFVQRSVVHY